MKYAKSKSLLFNLCKLVPVLVACIVSSNAKAATSYYLHVNGTAPGYGINANDNISWDGTVWATTATGAPTLTWQAGGFARWNSTTTPYTITVNNPESIAGLFHNAATTVTLNAAGSGALDITSGLQGFLGTSGGTLIINAPITGIGAITPETSGCNFKFQATNSYSGGTTFGFSGLPFVYFNNNAPFGTGPMTVQVASGSFQALLAQGGLPLTITNSWTVTVSGGGLNFASDPNTPVTCSGNWSLGANSINLRNAGGGTSPLTLSGVISGSGNLTLSANNSSLITLSGANTYSGQTILSAGNSGVTVGASSLNSVTGGTSSSSLGHPTTAANGTIAIGSAALTSTLIYTGPGETSDRVINLPGTTGGAILQADGTGALVLTANNTATGAGIKNLTLQGTNTAANSIGKIVNGSGTVGVVKAQTGTWKLTGANTYTGGTTVNAGTLEISGSVVGNVTNNTATLILDSNSALASTASVTLSSAGSVNLNFAGVQPITALVIDGVGEAPNQTWGAIGSGAQNENPVFTGTGILFVSGAPVVTQQPQSRTVFPDASVPFSVAVVGDPSYTYQWKHQGTNLPGANGSSLTISPAEAPD